MAAKPAKKIYVVAYTTEETRARVKKLAADSSRSVSKYMEFLINREWEKNRPSLI